MRRFIIGVAILLLLSVLVGPAAAGGRSDLVRTVFTVEGMHCDGCSSTITATLRSE